MLNRKSGFRPLNKLSALGLIILLLGFSLLTAGHFHSGLAPAQAAWNRALSPEHHSQCSLCQMGTLLSSLGLTSDFNFLTQELSCGLIAIPGLGGFQTEANSRPVRAPPFSA